MRNSRLISFNRSISLYFLSTLCQLGHAQDGVSERKILIGQTVGLTGQAAGPVSEMIAGSQAYFTYINKAGGIHGRMLELKILDDQFDPVKTLANTENLINKERIFALFQSRGTPQTEAILPLLASHQIPLIAPITGSSVFYEKKNRYLFSTRAKYQDEIHKGVEHFFTMGIKEISLLYVEDSFGKDGLTGFNNAMLKYQQNPIGIYSFDRAMLRLDTTLKALANSTTKALIIVGSSASVVSIIKNLREKNIALQIMTLSNNSSQSFIDSLGALGHGVIVSQIMPAPHLMTTLLGQEFKTIAKENGVVPSYAAMEGFVTAKILVEGLKRSGQNPTRLSLIKGLETMHHLDLGGLLINYDENHHDGSNFIELTIINKNGKFLR